MRRIRRLPPSPVLVIVVVAIALAYWLLRPTLEYELGLYRHYGARSAAGWLLHFDFRGGEPNVEWPSDGTSETDLDGDRLVDLRRLLAEHGTEALLIVQHGSIVEEWYPPGAGPNRKHPLAALSKAAIGSLILMTMLDDGRVDLDDPVATWVPTWRETPNKSEVTIRQLATHSSGLEDVRFSGSSEPTGWQLVYKKNRRKRFALAVSQADLIYPPGERYAYSGLGFYVLTYALTRALGEGPPSDLRSLLRDRIMQPLDIPDAAWSMSYGDDPYLLDGLKLVAIGSGGSFTPRALARIGQLLLQHGTWRGELLLSPGTVANVFQYGGSPEHREAGVHPPASLGWWINDTGFWPYLPRDAIVGAGVGHEILLIIPSLDLVVVRIGRELIRPKAWGPEFWSTLGDQLFKPLMDAVSSRRAEAQRPPGPRFGRRSAPEASKLTPSVARSSDGA